MKCDYETNTDIEHQPQNNLSQGFMIGRETNLEGIVHTKNKDHVIIYSPSFTLDFLLQNTKKILKHIINKFETKILYHDMNIYISQ